MRMFLGLLAVLPLLLAGCRSADGTGEARTAPVSSKGGGLVTPPNPRAVATNETPSVTLVLPTSGRIHAVNDGGQFVVIDYTLGGLPPQQSLLSVYRNGEKVGELRLSGPAQYGFATADIVNGFIQVDDEVRIR